MAGRPEDVGGETEVTLPLASIDARTPSDAGGGLFGAIAVELGFCSEDQLVEAITAARDRTNLADPPRLGEVLVDAGLLTPEQVRHVLDAQHKVVLQCPECARRFNAPSEPAHVAPECPACHVPLAPTEPLGAIRVDDTVDRRPDEAAAPLGAGSYDELIGRSLGPYAVRKLLGEGGMGAVFLAEHKLLKRHTALKVLPADLSHERERVRRFLREAEAMAQVRHPNIVGIHHVGSARGLYFIEMELVEGGTLAAHLRNAEVLDIDEAVELFEGVCAGLAAAHARGIVHRDVKADNVLLGPDGVPKVADFGLAKAVEGAPGSQDLTGGDNRVLGTPSYMSPEQANGEPADSRSDVYSLGVLFFEMLTGRKPFEGATPLAIMMQHLRDEAPAPQKLRPEIPRSLSNIVERCLAKAPTERYQDADALRAALVAYRQGAEIAYTARRIRRRRLRVVVGLAVLAAASAGAGVLYAELQKRGETRIVKVGETKDETIARLVREAEAAFDAGQAQELGRALAELKALASSHPLLRLEALSATRQNARSCWERGNLEGTIDAAGTVLAARANDPIATDLLERARSLEAARAAVGARDATAAKAGADAVLAREPNHAEATAIAAFVDAIRAAQAAILDEDWRTTIVQVRAALQRMANDPWAAELGAEAARHLKAAAESALASRDLPRAEAAATEWGGLDDADLEAVAQRVREARADFDRWLETGKQALAAGDGARAREAFTAARRIWKQPELDGLIAQAAARAWRDTVARHADAGDWPAALTAIADAESEGVDVALLTDLRTRCERGQADAHAATARAALSRGDLDAAAQAADAALALVTDQSDAAAVRAEVRQRRACPEGFVYLPPGDYPIGAPDVSENPPARVHLPGCYVAVHEVTNLQYAGFLVAGGYTDDRWWDAEALPLRAQFTDGSGQPGPLHWRGGAYQPGSEQEPVTGIGWYEARAYARWAQGRLPTEHEWEVAASFDPAAGTARAYPWGDTWIPRHLGLPTGGLVAVGSRRHDLSPLGVRDTAGNALEWTDGRWSADTAHRVIRGGGTHRLALSAGDPQLACRAAYRQMRADPGAARLAVVGFRIVRDLPKEGR